MSLIYVFAASKTEARSVEKLMNRHENDASVLSPGRIGTNDVIVFITGIGPKNASASASTALLNLKPTTINPSALRRPDAVLVVGMCGSLTGSIGEGEVIVYSKCLSSQSTSDQLHPTTKLVERVYSLLKTKAISSRSVMGISTPRIATTKSEKLALAKSGAEVVDMESYEILAVALQAQLPVAVVRVVSDSLDRQIPDFNLALEENGEISSLKLLKVALVSPILTAKAYLASRQALQKLSNALEIVLHDDTYARPDSDALSR
ncbi:MAG: hypothetical protein U0V70_07015 [Terriglobia bacterium]